MTQEGTTIVLGWDALDFDLAEQYGLTDSFGTHVKPIETYDSPTVGEPHTWELWPTLITGLEFEEHGIIRPTGESGLNWRNPLIESASQVANTIVPHRIRKRLGFWLRQRGAGVKEYTPDYYNDNNISTVFDDRASLSISVPNYHTEMDETFDFSFDRGPIFSDYINKRKNENGSTWEPTTSQIMLEFQVTNELMRRYSILRAAVERDFDLIWVWFGYLDTVGHLNPSLSDPLQQRAYRMAAEITEQIRDISDPDDSVVVVSDHGLKNGKHTHSPLFGVDSEAISEKVNTVMDVAPAIDSYSRSENKELTIREKWRYQDQSGDMLAEDVESSLEDLGYL